MKLFNTLHKSVEEFVPREEGKIKMYTCGPTVYHFAHIGNLRTYISEDILEKGFRYLGYDVQRVMNITDVGHLVGDGDTGEDKMLVAAKREHKSSRDIAKYYTECFFDDCRKLNIKKPDVVSNATDNIAEYIKIISKLLDNGYAYIAGGNVYYDTSKFEKYYDLSGTVCLVVAYDKNHTFTYPGERMNSGMEDAAIVATHLLLGAANAGVDSCWVNFFDPDKLAKALGLPENEEIVMLLDLGHAAEGAGPLPNHSSRKPLSETVTFL